MHYCKLLNADQTAGVINNFVYVSVLKSWWGAFNWLPQKVIAMRVCVFRMPSAFKSCLSASKTADSIEVDSYIHYIDSVVPVQKFGVAPQAQTCAYKIPGKHRHTSALPALA